MNGAGAPPPPLGPKTLLRAGARSDVFVARAGGCAAEPVRDRGAAARRALVDEIRAHAACATRKKRRR